ncbi:LTA synthase family protein [Pseudalkalibacillus hwajinpoensis]|uniref:LTA synthase family protein n=1 Tax=Guptibacillus hwajinpoensis TaxID=208199 RepID=UPI001CD2191F|nr:LTA synthase family protein [Pseudalkalibacillus hwajinpoensis]MCA0989877.1 LTA synthase family protein [Pseudalkalibacillus hwajinpoensis]
MDVERRKEKDLWRFYFLLIALLSLKTYLVYRFEFTFSLNGIGEELFLMINSIGSIALLLGIGLFRKQSKPGLMLAVYFVLSALLYCNILYYRFYIDFVTVPVLFQFGNVGGLGQSTVELLNLYDPFIVFDSIVLFWLLKRKGLNKLALSKKLKKRTAISSVAVLLCTATLALIMHPLLFEKSYDRELFVKSLGAYTYHVYDIGYNSFTSINSAFADDTELSEIEKYVKDKEVEPSSYEGIANGKNLILISLESTQAFMLNESVDGKEATPFLNTLKEDSFFFPNFYHQTAQGKTSDAEFMIDSSLYPLSGGSVFVRKPQNEFLSLPEALNNEGYTTTSFHGNDREFWNRSEMYETLGYDRFYSKKDFDVSDENSINYGLKDIPFFKQSIPYLKELEQPYSAKFLTLTNHFPYLLEEEDTLITLPETEEEVVNRYFATVRYEDESIKTFFEEMKAAGLYEDSIFVLYGDHYGLSETYDTALGEYLGKEIGPVEHVDLQKVPLIIHIPGEDGEVIDTVGGQIDLKPTILELLGVEESKSLNFGTSLFSEKRKDLVIFRDGSFITKNLIYTKNTCYNKESTSKTNRNKCARYFGDVQDELDYSDQVIYGDLLRFIQ